jgi:penicillin-binding protein 2
MKQTGQQGVVKGGGHGRHVGFVGPAAPAGDDGLRAGRGLGLRVQGVGGVGGIARTLPGDFVLKLLFGLLTGLLCGGFEGVVRAVEEERPVLQALPPPGYKAAAPVQTGSVRSTAAPSVSSQKNARVWTFSVPAPRGQICDRNGKPLAQQRIGINLGLILPAPEKCDETQLRAFLEAQAGALEKVLGHPVSWSWEAALKHQRNRRLLPWVWVQNLSESDTARVRESLQQNPNPSWEVMPLYLRHYPNGSVAGHLLGRVGRSGRFLDGKIESGELLFPDTVGQDGLELTLHDVLRGEQGVMRVVRDETGRKTSEEMMPAPRAGQNVFTTIDLDLQRLCEKALEAGCKRGAMVVMDPHSGEILALASWPPVDPNRFVPHISDADFQALTQDKNQPLFPRFSLAAYPPGSTFKCFVGLAGLSSGMVHVGDQFECPAAFQIGDRFFKNWKKENQGSLTFAEALEQSCNTWFYQVGMKLGPDVIAQYALDAGFGARTEIPFPAESPGVIPTDEYMRKTHGVRMVGGQVAMFAIGQGALEVTPLQMAQGMSVLANCGVLYQARLIKQIQDVSGGIKRAFDVQVRKRTEIPRDALSALRLGMTQVVAGGRGTAHQAKVEKVTVAGKTGTAQWRDSSTVAWFAGFAPVEGPRIAFSVVYEGDPHRNDVHGGSHAAPMIGKVLREYFKDPANAKLIKPRDAEGKEIDIDFRAPPPPKVVPSEAADQETPPEEPAPAPAPGKVPFWKRLFGAKG